MIKVTVEYEFVWTSKRQTEENVGRIEEVWLGIEGVKIIHANTGSGGSAVRLRCESVRNILCADQAAIRP